MKQIYKKSNYTVSSLTFEALEEIFQSQTNELNWNCLFVLPFWLKPWLQAFGGNERKLLLAVSVETELLGIAPLMLEGTTAKFMGSENVCDYQDMIITPKRGDEFFSILLSYLKKTGVSTLELGALKPDSSVLSSLNGLKKLSGYQFSCDEVNATFEINLPETWEDYLGLLKGKHRHEIRRKIRRLEEVGDIGYLVVQDQKRVMEAFGDFLTLFQLSRKDKAEFLTRQMNIFFQSMALHLSTQDMLKLSFLTINGVNAAATLCLQYEDTTFLYNNGYNPEFSNLSVGALSKIFSIKDSIDNKKHRYDFLKGNELYKQRFGGKPIPLNRIRIDL